MANRQLIGRKGEALAAAVLELEGYQILHQNWRSSRCEIDLIAKLDKLLVFVEVKTRRQQYFGPPRAFFTAAQQRRIFFTAMAYMEATGYDGPIRFDVVEVLFLRGETTRVNLVPDAFFPAWV